MKQYMSVCIIINAFQPAFILAWNAANLWCNRSDFGRNHVHDSTINILIWLLVGKCPAAVHRVQPTDLPIISKSGYNKRGHIRLLYRKSDHSVWRVWREPYCSDYKTIQHANYSTTLFCRLVTAKEIPLIILTYPQVELWDNFKTVLVNNSTNTNKKNLRPMTTTYAAWHPGSGVGQSQNVAVRDSTFHLVKLISNVNTDINNLFYRSFLYSFDMVIVAKSRLLSYIPCNYSDQLYVLIIFQYFCCWKLQRVLDQYSPHITIKSGHSCRTSYSGNTSIVVSSKCFSIR